MSENKFITDDFLLHNEVSKTLYHDYAKHQPIIDYHCHLSPKDIAEDPHYQARGVIETVQAANGLKVQVPGIIPKLSQNPGSIRYRAPTLGEHTDEVLKSAGLTEEQITTLKKSGVLA